MPETPPVPPEIFEKTAKALHDEMGDKCSHDALGDDCRYLANGALAAVYGDIVAEAQKDALAQNNHLIGAVQARDERITEKDAEIARLRAEVKSLREHALENPNMRALHDNAVEYRKAVWAYQELYGPLSTTLEWVIRHGRLLDRPAPSEETP